MVLHATFFLIPPVCTSPWDLQYCDQQVGYAVSKPHLLVQAEKILPEVEGVDLADIGKMVTDGADAITDLAAFLLKEEDENPAAYPRRLLEKRGAQEGPLQCERETSGGDTVWVATAPTWPGRGSGKEEGKWAAEELALAKAIAADILHLYFYNHHEESESYDQACHFLTTFDIRLGGTENVACPTCGHQCKDIESLFAIWLGFVMTTST